MIQQSKAVYRNSCKDRRGIPIFHRPEWLDVACGIENWEVITWHHNDQLAAALPYQTGKKLFWTTSTMPLLTPYLGIWINPMVANQLKIELLNKKIEAILNALDIRDLISFRNQPDFKGNLNWIWKKWELETRFTYLVKPNADILLENLDGKLRNDIKKAKSNLTVEKSTNLEELFNVVKASFERNSQLMPLTFSKLLEFHELIQKNKWGEILLTKDNLGNTISGNYFLWDDDIKYNWLSGYKKSEVSRGSVQLLLYDGMQSAIGDKKSFDFEGGVIRGIGSMFNSFPVEEVPVITSRKFKNKWIKALWSLR